MPAFITLSKLDVAKRELEFGISLFFQSGDPVVLHVVASSAQQILRDLCEEQKIPSFYQQMMAMIKKDKQKEFANILKKPYNFMKHGDREPNGVVKFSPESNEFALWDCIQMYSALAGEVTGLMMSFRGWFYASNPDLLLDPKDQVSYASVAAQTNLNNKRLFLDLAKELDAARVPSTASIDS